MENSDPEGREVREHLDRRVGPEGTLRFEGTAAEDGAAWKVRTAEGEATAAAAATAGAEEGDDRGDEGMVEAGERCTPKMANLCCKRGEPTGTHRQQTVSRTSPAHS